jgi:hypothetical protein
MRSASHATGWRAGARGRHDICRCAEAQQIAATKLVKHVQQMMLVPQTAFAFCDHRRALAVNADVKRIFRA